MGSLLGRNVTILGCCLIAVATCAAEVEELDHREFIGKNEGMTGLGGGCLCCICVGIPGPGIVVHTPYRIGVTSSLALLFLYPMGIWQQGDAQIIYDIKKGRNYYLYVGAGVGYCSGGGEGSSYSGKGIVGSLGMDVVLPRPKLFGFSNGSAGLSPKREIIVGVRLPYLLYGERMSEYEDYSPFLLPIPYVHFLIRRFSDLSI